MSHPNTGSSPDDDERKYRDFEAFPRSGWYESWENNISDQEGMMLVDYFAAKAMQAFIQTKGLNTWDCKRNVEGLASDVVEASYAIASLMMEERLRWVK